MTIQPYEFLADQHIVWLRVKRNKLESKLKRCYFIGFTKGTKAYRLWDPEKKSAFVSRDVVFDEEIMLHEKSKMEDKAQGGTSDSSTDSKSKEFEFSDNPNKHVVSNEDSDLDGDMQETTQEQQVQLRPLRLSDRVLVSPIRCDWDEDQASFALVTKVGDPSSYKKAIEADNSEKWAIAMERMMESLEKNQI